ncbi:hypothetical protein FOTG_14723 [Fusarium oxysporum f. sp. vasinfectum 25433]|uniref:Uncharacterized protein n=1 Tax=Fusarium oxysporum f. sp. vasinfectum 25433 TaxID=1089449 RepID=X0M8M3_FUSOX|nr:hypothetical protein FOTG_14723 [Fusarium oxysporum f. sp. vasinfectum 25433]
MNVELQAKLYGSISSRSSFMDFIDKGKSGTSSPPSPDTGSQSSIQPITPKVEIPQDKTDVQDTSFFHTQALASSPAESISYEPVARYSGSTTRRRSSPRTSLPDALDEPAALDDTRRKHRVYITRDMPIFNIRCDSTLTFSRYLKQSTGEFGTCVYLTTVLPRVFLYRAN